MIRYYCDGCGREMDNTVRNVNNHSAGHRLTFHGPLNGEGLGAITVTLTAKVAGQANGRHVCTMCALRVVNEGYEVRES